MNIKINSLKILADKTTPVRLYSILRDYFTDGVLLESSDYHTKEDSKSFICFDAIKTFALKDDCIQVTENKTITDLVLNNLEQQFEEFIDSINVKNDSEYKDYSGCFGHTTYDTIKYFEDIKLSKTEKTIDIDDFRYSFYRFQIIINHFNSEMVIIENQPLDEDSQLQKFVNMINSVNATTYDFKVLSKPKSNLTDSEFKAMVSKGKMHCQRGDVFQIVLSRRFEQDYSGDEFNVYRALRSINPSPYLFYFDYGNYCLLGSSPEAQIVVKNGKAQIHPIAGTYKRTGDDEKDRASALELFSDKKENSEHIMLVDLARNDLGRTTKNVSVKKFKEIQFFSHVIHLVSIVESQLRHQSDSLKIYKDTFPAGTLSGAPKYKAMQLIDTYEKDNRAHYGGAIGFISLNKDINQAIIIRTFLAKDQKLYYQAGAGVVINSDEQKELEEVNNKLAALRVALEIAETI